LLIIYLPLCFSYSFFGFHARSQQQTGYCDTFYDELYIILPDFHTKGIVVYVDNIIIINYKSTYSGEMGGTDEVN